MGLMLPSPGGLINQNNLSATPSSGGLTVNASASANTKGAWGTLIATTDFDTYGITIVIAGDTTAAAAVRNMYDIGVGAAGSEVAIISNFINCSSTLGSSNPAHGLFFPVFVPKGSRLSCRKQSNVGSQSSQITVWLHGGFSSPPWKAFAGADAIGVSTATSAGTNHTPGDTGVESTWANIGSTLGRQYSAMLPIISTGTDTTMSSLIGHVEIGIASTTLAEYLFSVTTNESIGLIIPSIPFYGNFPAGTQMMIRAEMSSTADANYDFALMGFY